MDVKERTVSAGNAWRGERIICKALSAASELRNSHVEMSNQTGGK
jgi:hypothetical protein